MLAAQNKKTLTVRDCRTARCYDVCTVCSGTREMRDQPGSHVTRDSQPPAAVESRSSLKRQRAVRGYESLLRAHNQLRGDTITYTQMQVRKLHLHFKNLDMSSSCGSLSSLQHGRDVTWPVWLQKANVAPVVHFKVHLHNVLTLTCTFVFM